LAATLIAPVAVGAEHVDHVDSAVVDGETNPAVESFRGHSQGDPGAGGTDRRRRRRRDDPALRN